MKLFKYIFFFSMLILVSCGEETKKDNGKSTIQLGSTKKQKAKDISINQGIGPIKDFAFSPDIDKVMIEKGASVFKAKCTACHLPDKKLIGPAVKGIYERRNPTWVMNLLLNPDQMLNEDPDAKAMLATFNNVRMLDQNLTEDEARALSEYMKSL